MAGTLDELSLHKATGQYYKTCRRRRYYFGTDAKRAVKRYKIEWPYIERGLPIPAAFNIAGPPVVQVLDLWLESKRDAMDAGRIKPATFNAYQRVAELQATVLGRTRPAASITPIDFAKVRSALPGEFGVSAVVLSRTMTICRMPWRWAYESELLEKPIRFGPDFTGPTKGDIRRQRHERGRQIFTAAELRAMLDLSDPRLSAMIYLGINGAYTQSEIAALAVDEVDLSAGLIDHLRNKTDVPRTVPLWPETVAAIHAYLEIRKDPRGGHGNLLFVSKKGMPVVYESVSAKGRTVRRDSVQESFAKVRDSAGIKLQLAGFGKLRATFRTVADGCRDANAIRRVMGHEVGEGAEPHYIRSIGRDRLDAVVSRVRSWLNEAD